jgi:hypothetical protein
MSIRTASTIGSATLPACSLVLHGYGRGDPLTHSVVPSMSTATHTCGAQSRLPDRPVRVLVALTHEPGNPHASTSGKGVLRPPFQRRIGFRGQGKSDKPVNSREPSLRPFMKSSLRLGEAQ